MEAREIHPIEPSVFERQLRRWYVRFVLPHARDPIVRQRLKLLWYVWGYWPLLFLPGLSLLDRLRTLARFVRIDWNVLHAHLPAEIVCIGQVLAERPARPGEIVVEAGCWTGGSSTKFSILCRMLGYRLQIYDSFEGVERLPPDQQAQEWPFAGQYASPESVLRANLARYGEPTVCSIHKGWFSETLAAAAVSEPVRLAYIDCDLAKATGEVLSGLVPALVDDGVVFSQDFHIEPVRRLLSRASTWTSLGMQLPSFSPVSPYMVGMRLRRLAAVEREAGEGDAEREITFSVRAWHGVRRRLLETRQRLRMHCLSRRPAELMGKLAGARTLLFVCHGNLIRSPFAAELLRARISGSDDIEVLSAGLWAVPGDSADVRVVERARRFDVDLSSHRTKPLERSELERADVILAMEVGQVVEIRRLFPGEYRDTYLLGCLEPSEGLEIRDPATALLEMLEACFGRIEKSVDRILRIRAARGSGGPCF